MTDRTVSEKVGYRFASLRIRRFPLFEVDITTALSAGGRALVCIPDDQEHAKDALSVCDRLAEWFSPLDVLLLSRGTELFRLPPTRHSVLSVPAAINRFGLPYRQVIQRTVDSAPVVAFDLHPTFHVASAYLCVMSGARLRAGLHAPDEGFFNLNYRWPADDAPLAAHYERFLQFLDSLRGSRPVSSHGE